MKVGYRKPSIKKSIKARTTGKVKRQIKSSINPTYGKKGMGWINDPKKAAYNKVYNKTTRSIFDDISYNSHSTKSHNSGSCSNSKDVSIGRIVFNAICIILGIISFGMAILISIL
ncbi:hypothetical protein [Gemella morbillorum]